MMPSRLFDGFDPQDPAKSAARRILDAAIEDEVRLRGKAICSDSLCCFIEYRMSQALGEVL